MYPFPYTGLRLLHEEKVRDAMERARIDAELDELGKSAVALNVPIIVPLGCPPIACHIPRFHHREPF